MTVISLDDVTRRYTSAAATVVAVDGASLELRGGEMVGLVGPSGSGKTTLLHLIVGWETPDDGTIVRNVAAGWDGVAVVPQGIGLLPELTAFENADAPRRLGNDVRRPLDQIFDELGLTGVADRLPSEISIGEQQRVAVARASAVTPSLLVADEPTAHQDEAHAARVVEALAECAAAGSAVLLSTHDERMLGGLDRVVHMLDGRLHP